MGEKVCQVVQLPADHLVYTNRAVGNAGEFANVKHVEIINSQNHSFVFSVEPFDRVNPGTLAFNLPARKWAMLSVGDKLRVKAKSFSNTEFISKITLEVDFLLKNKTTTEAYDTDEMAREFLQMYPKQAFTIGQSICFRFKEKLPILEMKVKSQERLLLEPLGPNEPVPQIRTGVLFAETQIIFEKGEGNNVNLTGKAKGKLQQQSIINPNWDFLNMGIGGLDREFNAIFRRAFASRVFPAEIVEQLGLKHVRGILLYGPPGTGKTLMARQIGQMLNAREPKIVNGPQILDKYVGESEANIRRLFEDAEAEFKRCGNNSGLHIIIFDEIDAICKARGSVAGGGGGSGVHDTVVNQLLSKIDGVESLNNILVIGMTNRRDMIDEALMRPGRLEVQMEIGLPDQHGRLQILNIHTTRMREHGKLNQDVKLEEIAALTKNFSGAELEGLVRAAQSCAMNRLIKASSKVEVDPNALEKLSITRNDFLHALEHDVKPAFGSSNEAIETLIKNGIISWGPPLESAIEEGLLRIEQTRDGSLGIVSILLEGPPDSGKTALAAYIALKSEFPFIKLCSPDDMVGFTETSKCMCIRKVFDDAYKSALSCIVVDNLERLLDYGSVGARYSNYVLQALCVLLKKSPPNNRKLVVICTTSKREVMEQLELISAFTKVIRVPAVNSADGLNQVLLELAKKATADGSDFFTPAEIQAIHRRTQGRQLYIGIKRLIAAIDAVRRLNPQVRAQKFLLELEEDGALSMSAGQ